MKEIGAVAPRIKDYDSWHAARLELATRAEAEKRWGDAASYCHGAEFYLPAGDVHNKLYDDFKRNWARSMQGVAGYEQNEVPYPGGHLPGVRLQAKGKEISTFIFHGGYHSFVEEFFAFLQPLSELGFTVIGFDGPGQGGAVRQGIYLEPRWEKPAKAVLDYFGLDAVDRLGASCGGYLSVRAAAFESRIKHIISMPPDLFRPRHDVEADAARQGGATRLVAQGRRSQGLRGADRRRALAEFGVRLVRDPGHAHHRHQEAVRLSVGDLPDSLEGILHHVKRDILLTEGEQDHLFNVDWIHRAMRELVCARSVSARIFTAREGGEQHCQVGNSGLAREEIVNWLSRFYPSLRTIKQEVTDKSAKRPMA